jgi:hypothetical protein
MSKRERLEYLEAEIETHREALKTLTDRVRELEQLKKPAAPLPLLPNTIINYWSAIYCTNCGQYYRVGVIHNCQPNQWWNPNRCNNGTAYCFNCGKYYFSGIGHVCGDLLKITCTNKTGAAQP